MPKCSKQCCGEGARDYLYHLYIELEMPMTRMARVIGCSTSHIYERLKFLGLWERDRHLPKVFSKKRKGRRERDNPLWYAPLDELMTTPVNVTAIRYGVSRWSVYRTIRERRILELEDRKRKKRIEYAYDPFS